MNLARGLFYKIASPWGPSILAMHLCSHACLSKGAQFCTLMSWGLLCSRVVCHFFGGPLIHGFVAFCWLGFLQQGLETRPSSPQSTDSGLTFPPLAKSMLSDAHTGFTIYGQYIPRRVRSTICLQRHQLVQIGMTCSPTQERPEAFPAFAIPAPFPFS